MKLKLFLSITSYIIFCYTFNNNYINDLKIVLDIKLNLWVFNYIKSYKVKLILKVFYNKF